jgi:hypothetical protein
LLDEDSGEEESFLPKIKRHNIFLTTMETTSKRLRKKGFVAIAAKGETCERMMSNTLYYNLANRERVMPTLMEGLLR